MTIVLWALAALLAVVFLAAGAMKLIRSKERLTADPSMAWAGPFPPGVIKTIGALEVLAAIGLILPAALGIVPVLVPLAAVGLVFVMIGAALTHARRKECQPVAVNIALLALAAFVALAAWARTRSDRRTPWQPPLIGVVRTLSAPVPMAASTPPPGRGAPCAGSTGVPQLRP